MPDDFKDYYRKGYGPGSPEHTVLFLCVVALIAGLALAAVWAT